MYIRYKPKKKLPKECIMFYEKALGIVADIVHTRSYLKVLNSVEEKIYSEYCQYQYDKRICQGLYQEGQYLYHDYHISMFEKQTEFKCYAWSIWFCKIALEIHSRTLPSDEEEKLLKNLEEKYNKIILDEECPLAFLEAWEEFEILKKRKSNTF